ncbi:MAG: hypothetical protein Q7W13_13150 [Bacteroidia bacterium]|nr:hypothetical protein [Bacteroidia bacterium]
MDLFGNKKEIIRSIGFYQPFGSLMFHGKVETRFVRKGKKPPFPKGKYLIYTTKKECDNATLYNWCGNDVILDITKMLHNSNDETRLLNGWAIGIATLSEIKILTPTDKSYVKFIGEKIEIIDDIPVTKIQWALHFKDIFKIKPFEWKHGKQGIGFVPECELQNIIIE